MDQIFVGSTPLKYLTDVCPSNVWRVYTPEIFDGCMSVKYLEGLHLPKYLTDVEPSNIWGVDNPKIIDGCMYVRYSGGYTPKEIDGCMSVKYLGGLHLPKI